MAIVAAFNKKLPVLSSQKRLLLLCSLPLIFVATTISFFRNVLPHWTGPGYTGIILLTACYFSTRKLTIGVQNRKIPLPLGIGISVLVFIIIVGVLQINYYPGSLGKKEKGLLGQGDFTLDMYGWNTLKPAFEKIIQSDVESGQMKSDALIISNKWFPAAHIDYYVAMPLKKDLIAIGDTNSIHQYAWINQKRKKLQRGDDAYCIVPSGNYFDVKETYASLFKIITAPSILVQRRNGKVCRFFYVYRLKNYAGI